MANEKTSLLSGKSTDHGATSRPAKRQSRFGDAAPDKGVRPNRASIQFAADAISAAPPDTSAAARSARMSVAGGVGLKKRSTAKSFLQRPDGSISTMTPVEMGRDELYRNVPFTAVYGLQKRERAMTTAFSNFAASLDIDEANEHLVSTTGKGMGEDEKKKKIRGSMVMMMDELESESAVSVTMPLVFAVLIASFLQFNVGYNISVMNPLEPYAFVGHSTLMWSMAVSAFCIGGPFGAVLAGKWADSKGRVGALSLAAWLFIIAGVLQTLAPNMLVVIVARAIIGVASGASSVLVPIYLGELAPPNLRGVIGTMTQFALVIGILIADVVGFWLGNEKLWRGMFLIIAILGAAPLLMKPLLLESPRWLLANDPDSEHARFVIKTLRGFRYNEQVDTEVQHYLGASKSQSLEGDDDEPSKEHEKDITAELFGDKSVRLLLVSALVFQVSQQLCGINAVFYYSGLFFDGIIENPLVGTTLMGAINVVATYGALLLMDRCGRRTLIMWSSAGMFLSCVMIVLALLGYFDKMAALFAVAAYVTFFELGLGPIPSLIVAEMFDGKYVTTAMSLCSQLNWVCNFFVGLFFPVINNALGPYSFAPFAVILLLTFFYAWIWLPETAGVTPAELQAQLVKKNENIVYHNMDVEGLAGSAPQPVEDDWANALADLTEEGVV